MKEQGQTNITFTISEADAAALYDLQQLQGVPDLTAAEYAKLLLLNDIHPERGTRAILEAIRQGRKVSN